MSDDTLEFIESLKRETKNKKLRRILDCIIRSSPSIDLAYGDWNDRQDFMEEEYDVLVDGTVKVLEGLIND